MPETQIHDLTLSAAELLLSLDKVPRFLEPEEFEDGHLLQKLGLVNIGLGSSLDGRPPRNAWLTDLGHRIKASLELEKATEKTKTDPSVFERHDRIVTTAGVYVQGEKEGGRVIATIVIYDCTFFEARSVAMNKFFEEIPDAAITSQGTHLLARMGYAIDRGEEQYPNPPTNKTTASEEPLRITKGRTYLNGLGHPVKILRNSWLHRGYFIGDDHYRYSLNGWHEYARSPEHKSNLVSLVG